MTVWRHANTVELELTEEASELQAFGILSIKNKVALLVMVQVLVPSNPGILTEVS